MTFRPRCERLEFHFKRPSHSDHYLYRMEQLSDPSISFLLTTLNSVHVFEIHRYSFNKSLSGF